MNGNDLEQIVTPGRELMLDAGWKIWGSVWSPHQTLESNDDIGYKGAHVGASNEGLHLLPLQFVQGAVHLMEDEDGLFYIRFRISEAGKK